MLERYCVYCHKSEKEIRRDNIVARRRIPCEGRDTEKGFHSFGFRCSKCLRHWRECICGTMKENEK